MSWTKFPTALLLLAAFQTSQALAKDVVLDLSSIAPNEAKTAPPAPKEPALRNVEMLPDDILVVRCPAKAFPGAKGWIEYHSHLMGSGCLISTMRQEPHVEAFQATGPGSQKIIVGLKQAGSSDVEKDCLVIVKVVSPPPQTDTKSSSPNVQSFSGTTVYGNKTSATTGVTTVKGFSQPADKNLPKPAAHSVEEQSKSTVKTY